MAANSAIQWTELTWQLTFGCLLRSAGCLHCYAEQMAKRLKAMALADIAAGKDPGRKRYYIDVIGDDGCWNGNVVPCPEALADPFGWRKPRMVFVDSMSDLFYGDERDDRKCRAKWINFTPVPFAFLDQCLATMYQAQWHTYQLLTKRPARASEYLVATDRTLRIGTAAYELAARMAPKSVSILTNGDFVDDVAGSWPLSNVWLGTSVENKRELHRIDELRKCPAAVRFLSCEPLLEDVGELNLAGIHWVILGGESGPGARNCDVQWFRSIIRQCRRAGVAVFVKQLGARAFDTSRSAAVVPKKWTKAEIDADPEGAAGELEAHLYAKALFLEAAKGDDPKEWPKDLQIREYPKTQALAV